MVQKGSVPSAGIVLFTYVYKQTEEYSHDNIHLRIPDEVQTS
jgi:hypothetical protein